MYLFLVFERLGDSWLQIEQGVREKNGIGYGWLEKITYSLGEAERCDGTAYKVFNNCS